MKISQDLHATAARRLSGWIHVEDYGATPGSTSSQTAAFQAAIDAAFAKGGGVVIGEPRSSYRLDTTITIRPNVTLYGQDMTAPLLLDCRPSSSTMPAIKFSTGSESICRGWLHNVKLTGDPAWASTPLSRNGIGVSLSGSQFNHVTCVDVWDFLVGFDLSDGVLDYSGYNTIQHFEANRCKTGLRAFKFCNQNSAKDGRIFYSFGGSADGVALDIKETIACSFSDIALEAFDTGVRIRSDSGAAVIVSLHNVYEESGANGSAGTGLPGTPRRLWDLSGVDWSVFNTKIRITGCHAGGHESDESSIPPEANFTWDGESKLYFGAQRHPASATHDNLAENGNITLYTSGLMPGWFKSSNPTVSLLTTAGQWETEGQAIKITQAGTSGDTLSCTCVAPEPVGYVSASIRYFIPPTNGSTNVQFTLNDGTNASNIVIAGGATSTWRWANLQMKRNAPTPGTFYVSIQPDLDGLGREVWIDRVIATGGRVAPADRMFGQRVWMLENPIEVHESTTTANQAFVIDADTFTGLAKMPSGAVGIILAVHGEFAEVAPQAQFDVHTKSCYVWINPNGQPSGRVSQIHLHCLVAGEYSSGMYHLRFSAGNQIGIGTINNTGISRNNTVWVDLHGWIMPH